MTTRPSNTNAGWMLATKTLLDAAKVMLPLVTGAFVFTVKYLADTHVAKSNETMRTLISSPWTVASAVLTFASIGLWTGVLPFCIRAQATSSEISFKCAQVCAQMAHACFFSALLCVGCFYVNTGDEAFSRNVVVALCIGSVVAAVFLRWIWSVTRQDDPPRL